MNHFECPTCHQDLRAGPHDGLHGKDCPQCGQGLQWRLAAKMRANKRVQPTLIRSKNKKVKRG